VGRRVEIARSWCAIAVLIATAAGPACKRSGERADPEKVGEVVACSRALEAATAEKGREAVRELARGCPHACPGLEDWANADDPDAAASALIAECALACTPEAAEAFAAAGPGQRYRVLVERCGADHYHLPAEDGHLMSDVWFVLDLVGRWLHQARGAVGSDADAAAALEQATLRAHFPLPLPTAIEGLYRLPASTTAAPAHAGFYVIVAAGEVRAAAVPVARLRGQTLELRPVPGGELPGQPLPADRMGPAYADLVDAVRALHPEGQGDIDEQPLILTDHGTPLARLLEVATALGVPSFRVGVAAHGAWAHPVALERLTHATAAPLLQILEDDYVLPAEADDSDQRIPRTEVERMRTEVVHFVVMRAPLRKVEVRVHPGATLDDLIPLLDALDQARIDAVLFSSEPAVPPSAPEAAPDGD
jgi:hypothetical protein